jgi:hypothetical protein
MEMKEGAQRNATLQNVILIQKVTYKFGGYSHEREQQISL